MSSGDAALMLVVTRHDAPVAGVGELWNEPGTPTTYWRLADVEQATAPADVSADVAASSSSWIGEQLFPGPLAAAEGAGAVLAVFQEPVPSYEDEFNEWMDSEHVPALGSVEGVLTARRFRAVSGEPRYLGLYHLAAAGVCESDEWRQASDTPWRERIRPHTRRRSRHLLLRSAP